MRHQPIAVSVLTGFLGAGKTTLLNALLADPALKNTAVIINEFGDVSIDHLLVESAGEDIIQLADGCLCCTVRGDLVDTLAGLVDRLQSGRLAALDRIVVETSGLADPVPVLHALMAHPALAQALRLDGVVTVVDAVNAGATLDRHAESVRQVAVADRLVVSKSDLPGAAPAGTLERRLRALNSNAAVVRAGEAGPSTLLDCGLYDPRTKHADVSRWLGEEQAHAPVHRHDRGHHDHAHDDHHHHDGHTHDGRVRCFSLTHPAPVAWSTIEMFLDLLRSTHGDRLLRMKGVVELADDPDRPVVLHGVQRIMHPPARLPAWPDGMRGTRLVLIGFDLDETQVRRLFSAFTGGIAVDAPDAAALSHNPLAVPGFGR